MGAGQTDILTAKSVKEQVTDDELTAADLYLAARYFAQTLETSLVNETTFDKTFAYPLGEQYLTDAANTNQLLEELLQEADTYYYKARQASPHSDEYAICFEKLEETLQAIMLIAQNQGEHELALIHLASYSQAIMDMCKLVLDFDRTEWKTCPPNAHQVALDLAEEIQNYLSALGDILAGQVDALSQVSVVVSELEQMKNDLENLTQRLESILTDPEQVEDMEI